MLQIPQVIMPYRSRRVNALRPVNRIKHVIDSQFAVAAGATQDLVIVNSTDTPVLGTVADCETGSTVNGIFIVVEVHPIDAVALPNVYFWMAKNPGGNLTLPNPNVVGASDNKKYIFHQEMVMLQKIANGNPRTLMKGVIVIPKHYRRNGPNDQILVRIQSPGVAINACMQAHYKEFR